jgi:hypothetical protein
VEQRELDDPMAALMHLAKIGRLVRYEPRMRTFAAAGWTVFLYPLDVFETRAAAWRVLATVTGFDDDEIVTLRSRQIRIGDEPTRTWWLFAVRNDRVGAAFVDPAECQSSDPHHCRPTPARRQAEPG